LKNFVIFYGHEAESEEIDSESQRVTPRENVFPHRLIYEKMLKVLVLYIEGIKRIFPHRSVNKSIIQNEKITPNELKT